MTSNLTLTLTPVTIGPWNDRVDQQSHFGIRNIPKIMFNVIYTSTMYVCVGQIIILH